MLKVYPLVLELVRRLAAVVREIERRDRNLADQLRRSVTAAALNTAEGQHGRGRRKQASFSVAHCEAKEARACLDVAVAFGYVAPVDDATAQLHDRVIATLYKLAR